MKRFLSKLTIMFSMFTVSVMSFAGNLGDVESGGFKIDKNGSINFDNGGKTDYSGGFWNSITEFIQQWGNGLTWVLAAVGVLAFIIGLYKYVSNPDLTQVIVSLITTVIFILLAIKSRTILNTTLSGEITPDMIEQTVRHAATHVGSIIH